MAVISRVVLGDWAVDSREEVSMGMDMGFESSRLCQQRIDSIYAL